MSDIDRYIALLAAQPPLLSLHHPSREIVEFLKGVKDRPAFHKSVMLALMERFVQTPRITKEVADLYRADFERIKAEMATNAPEFYELPKDPFVKDLSICCGKAFPAAAQIVETMSGIGRRILYAGGVGSVIPVAAFFAKSGGFAPWYQIHTHSSTFAHFNEDGWNRCYRLIAGMLKLNPEIRGMFGVSWFYDPALEEISPRLGYLRHVPVSGGARFFYRGGDRHQNVANATAKSETRRKLYEQGKYNPVAYLMIWQRNEMLRWATQGS